MNDTPSPGTVRFELDGQSFSLDALEGGDEGELFLVFGDKTNGPETYGGGRFLYTDPPREDGTVVVDFNRSYSPPCIFTPYATCPLPPYRTNYRSGSKRESLPTLVAIDEVYS